MPPSIQHLEQRLQFRETETPESIDRRIKKAADELKTAIFFDKTILNDDLKKAFIESEKIVSEFLSQ